MEFSVLIVIPAFNEENTIKDVLKNVKANCPNFDILVVNDASNDRTSSFAKETDLAEVVDLPINLGIGGAVQTGLKYAFKMNYQCVVQFDADGQHKAEDINKLVLLIEDNLCDVAIGSRFVGDVKNTNTDFMRRIGIRIFEIFSLVLIQKRVKDHTSGFRAFNKKALNFIVHEYPVDYPEPEIVVYLARNGFVIKEIFTQMFERQGGLSSISFIHGPYYMIKVMLAMFMAVLRPKEN